MSRRDHLTGGDHNSGEHGSHRDTARISYERLREAGRSHDDARKGAEKIATDVHRIRDRKG